MYCVFKAVSQQYTNSLIYKGKNKCNEAQMILKGYFFLNMFLQSYDLHTISYKMTRVKTIANLHESIFQKLFKTITFFFFYLGTTHVVKSWNVIFTHTNHLTVCCIIQIVRVFVGKQRDTFNVLFEDFNTMACKYVNQAYQSINYNKI